MIISPISYSNYYNVVSTQENNNLRNNTQIQKNQIALKGFKKVATSKTTTEVSKNLSKKLLAFCSGLLGITTISKNKKLPSREEITRDKLNKNGIETITESNLEGIDIMQPSIQSSMNYDASSNTIPTASLVNESQMTNEIPKTAEEIAEELVTKNIENNINNFELRTREEMLDLFKVFDITESDLEGIDFMQPSIQSFMNFYSLLREYGGPIPGATKQNLLSGLRKENSDLDTIASMFAHIKREHFELIKENLPSESSGIDLYSTLLTRIVDDGGDFNIVLKNKIDVYKKLKELFPHENKYYHAGIVGQINENNASKLLNFITEIVEKDKLSFLNLCYMVESFGISSDAIDNKIIMYKFLKEEGVPIENAQKIIGNINDDSANARIELFKILKSEGFDNDLIDKSLRGTNNFNIQARKELIELLKAEQFDNFQIAEIINRTKGNDITSKVEILKLLKDNPDCSIELKTEFISATEDYNFQFIKDLYNEIGIDVGNTLQSLTSKRVNAQTQIFKILKERGANIKKSTVIIEKINDKNLPLAKVLCEEGIFSEAEIEKIVLSCDGRINSSGEFERQTSVSELIDAKLELYQYFKENSLIPKKPLPIKEQMSEHVELQLGGKLKYPLIESGADIISVVNKSNINLAKKLCHKDLDPMLIKQILVRYENKSDDIILKFIDDGLLAKYPKLAECPANSWKAIIDKNLTQYIGEFPACTIVELSRSNNPNLLNDFISLRKDAFSHRSLLKSGIEDLSDLELNSLLNTPEIAIALNVVGKGTLEAAFPLKVEGFKDCCEDIARLKLSPKNMEILMQKINPTCSRTYRELSEKKSATKRRINELVGEETCNQIKALQNQRAEIEEQLKVLTARKNELATTLGEDAEEVIQLKIQIKDLQKQSKSLGVLAQSLYFKGENADEIKRIMNGVNALNKQLQNLTKESKSLEPQDILTKIRVLAAISEKADDKEIAKFIELIKPSNADNNANWNEAINRKLFDVLGVEYNEAVSARLDLINCKYLADMFLSDEQFNQNFAKLINLVKEHPDKSIAEIFDLLPQNQETRKMFEDIGVDYDKWCQIDKDSYKSARIQLDAEKAKQAAIRSLEEDFNDHLFKLLPKENTQQILDNLEAIGITLKRSQVDVFVGDGVSAGQKEFYRLYKDGNPIVFEDMPQIISIIEKTINKDEFWFREHPNVNINEARKHIYEHLIKLRTNDVDVAKSIATNDVVELEIRKTDMYDIKKAIGLGNDGQCCTAVGNGVNAFSAPTYIMNKCIGAIELVDQGNFVGNTMIYLANVDGKPALVLDNIELKSKYRYNDTIRDTFMDYAKQLCDEIGQPDLPIYAGPNRHKLTMDAVYPKEKHSMQIIGSTGEDTVYIDGITSGMAIDGQATLNLEMYKIR